MPSIEIVNEFALKLHFNVANVVESASHIASLSPALSARFAEIIDLIPAYNTLTVLININRTTSSEFYDPLQRFVSAYTFSQANTQCQHHTLPCYYGDGAAWDLKALAEAHGMSCDNVVERHQAGRYRVYAIGFSPGFPYLGFVDDSIATPRKTQPRTWVPKGAVGIAGKQTGIYPQSSPGGWNIIGNCPLMMFDYENPDGSPARLNVGDTVSFRKVSKDEFILLGGEFHHPRLVGASQ